MVKVTFSLFNYCVRCTFPITMCRLFILLMKTIVNYVGAVVVHLNIKYLTEISNIVLNVLKGYVLNK